MHAAMMLGCAIMEKAIHSYLDNDNYLDKMTLCIFSGLANLFCILTCFV